MGWVSIGSWSTNYLDEEFLLGLRMWLLVSGFVLIVLCVLDL